VPRIKELSCGGGTGYDKENYSLTIAPGVAKISYIINEIVGRRRRFPQAT